MSDDNPTFIWKKFRDVPGFAIKQIIAFMGDCGFFEPLWKENGGDFHETEIMQVIVADTDLRMSKEELFDSPSPLDDLTIYIK